MTIEVKQLIIKSTLVDEHPDREAPGADDTDIEAFRQQIIEECKALIEQSLQKSRER